jgi:hypothetical protein
MEPGSLSQLNNLRHNLLNSGAALKGIYFFAENKLAPRVVLPARKRPFGGNC